jgi:hypothetical protein
VTGRTAAGRGIVGRAARERADGECVWFWGLDGFSNTVRGDTGSRAAA